uniref:Uncharacterized protein n=1 Tax=Nelumbo nucifera TaxID=4432 RepID=A0A822XPW0_NELNU|nr:TPA_asm: hypothetical protein HUJ06_022228 [Nelumbo nucifera]
MVAMPDVAFARVPYSTTWFYLKNLASNSGDDWHCFYGVMGGEIKLCGEKRPTPFARLQLGVRLLGTWRNMRFGSRQRQRLARARMTSSGMHMHNTPFMAIYCADTSDQGIAM